LNWFTAQPNSQLKNMLLLEAPILLLRSYISDTGYVHTSIVHCNLTALCLQYLTFECFEQDVSQDRLSDFAIQGYFAFQDYAVANWSHHFCAMVEDGQSLLYLGSDNEIDIQELDDALNEFTNNYEEDILQDHIEGSSEGALKSFNHCDFYNSLQWVWGHVRRHQERGFDARNDVSLKFLNDALSRNRKLLEELTSSPNCSFDSQKDLDSFYGEKRYKCPKLTCFYFHEGFKDGKSRQLHIDRHDRPFRCTFPNCSVADFGFRSSKELERHMKSFHPEVNDQVVTFTTANTVPTQTRWPCHMCDKRFTRSFHLRSHIRSHNGDRPFACSECGKAFTRDNDRKRHEKIHARQ
jgi:Zinc finger, C2H2 type